MLHYSYCAVGICGRLFEGETYSLRTSHELGVMPQEQLEIHFFVGRLPEDGHQMCDNETPRKGKAALRLIGPSIGLLFFVFVPISDDKQNTQAAKTTLVF